jgi:hypothetical protein
MPPLRIMLLLCMRVKTLCNIRSSTNPGDVMTAEVSIPKPKAAWDRSTMTEAKIQALVNRGLIQPKEEVEWRVAAREQFPSEDVKKHVVFASFFERDFTSRREISSAVCCTLTCWSWYISFPTP